VAASDVGGASVAGEMDVAIQVDPAAAPHLDANRPVSVRLEDEGERWPGVVVAARPAPDDAPTTRAGATVVIRVAAPGPAGLRRAAVAGAAPRRATVESGRRPLAALLPLIGDGLAGMRR
jgi:hypothetical protein